MKKSLIHAIGRSARTIFELRGTRSASENGPDSCVARFPAAKPESTFAESAPALRPQTIRL
jgi:hypothetical protein